MNNKIIIAIDGHSSTGKSTLAKMLANKLGYKHINTGSMYRAVTLYAYRNNLISKKGVVNHKKLTEELDNIKLDFTYDCGKSIIIMNGENVSHEVNKPLVSQHVSEVSVYSKLREKIVSAQRNIARAKGVVMEGRDIGSVVFPSAEIKLFITASLRVRAERRYKEMTSLGHSIIYQDVYNNLKMRDYLDSNRANSPLVKVDDAVLIDNTNLSIEEQLLKVMDIIKSK